MTLKTWSNFSKRKNSTLQPSGVSKDYTVYLKENTSLEKPVFILGTGIDAGLNYCQIFGYYYFIDDIVMISADQVEVHCSIDYLATYKAAIQATSAYVLYYSHNNTEIVDSRLSTKTTIATDITSETFHNLGTGESYMLTAVGVDHTSIFACDKGDIDALFTTSTLAGVQQDYNNAIQTQIQAIQAISASDVPTMIQKVFELVFNWLQVSGSIVTQTMYSSDVQKFAKNCFVLPIAKGNIGGHNESVFLGKFQSNAEGNVGFGRTVYDSATLSIPWQANDWRRNAPYHEIYLYVPYIGLINIPASEVIDVNSITVNVALDTYSGVASFVVNAANGTVIGQYSTNIASPYAVGSSNINIVGAGAQIISAGASIATGNAAGVALSALGIANSIRPFDSSITGNGGSAGYGLGNTVKCITIFHDTTVAPSSVSSVVGTPYNAVMSLSGVSGYVQTSNASVNMAGEGGDKDIVNGMLNSGIYIE